MTKQILYRYLGVNGVIESPIHLEDIYYVRINVLTAQDGYILTNGNEYKHSVRCSDEEVKDWIELPLDKI